MLLLNNRIYVGYSCIDLKGIFDIGAFERIQNTVKTKALDLCMRLEKVVPASAEIEIGPGSGSLSRAEAAQVATVVHQIFNGPFTSIVSTGSVASISLTVGRADEASLRNGRLYT